jgi:Leucine-rich repeat (LRR) protein
LKLWNFTNFFKDDQNVQTDRMNARNFYFPNSVRGCIESDFFDGATNMTVIRVGFSGKLKLLKGIFFGLTNLEKLEISSISPGYIKKIHSTIFQGLKRLKTISLSNTQLDFAKIYPRIFAGLKLLRQVNITGNLNTNSFSVDEMKKYCGCNATVIQ